MSNYLAVATVTATLQKLLQMAVQGDLDGARVTTLKPGGLGNGTPENGINLYLYQVVLNPMWRNSADIRSRSRQADSVKRSRTALDLHYMLSFYGNEVELEPQRLLGSAVRTLTDRQAITTEMIQETVTDSSFRYLAGSNLMRQVEEITFVPLDLSLEDLSKVWSVFFQTPYMLSIAYRATVVMIEGEDANQRALPVRDRALSQVAPFPGQPIVQEVVSQAGKFEPIFATSTLIIRGVQLKSQITQIRIGSTEVIPPVVSDHQITIPLSVLPADALRAGVQTLQVVHRLPIASGASQSSTQTIRSINRVESNAAPFMLCPAIQSVSVASLEDSGEDLRSALLMIQVDLSVSPQQRVVLALNEYSIQRPVAYLFEASPRLTETRSISIPIRQVQPGEYLVRLQIDGAESALSIDTNPDSPTFNWYVEPKVALT